MTLALAGEYHMGSPELLHFSVQRATGTFAKLKATMGIVTLQFTPGKRMSYWSGTGTFIMAIDIRRSSDSIDAVGASQRPMSLE